MTSFTTTTREREREDVTRRLFSFGEEEGGILLKAQFLLQLSYKKDERIKPTQGRARGNRERRRAAVEGERRRRQWIAELQDEH